MSQSRSHCLVGGVDKSSVNDEGKDAPIRMREPNVEKLF